MVSLASSLSRHVAVRELTHEHMVFVCDSSHPLAHRDRVQLADLAGQDFIHFPRGWGIRQRLDAGFAAVGVQPTSAYEVVDYAIAAELVRHRLAATVLPISAADRFPDLRVIPLNPPLRWTLYLASAESQSDGGAVKALVDTITRYVEG